MIVGQCLDGQSGQLLSWSEWLGLLVSQIVKMIRVVK